MTFSKFNLVAGILSLVGIGFQANAVERVDSSPLKEVVRTGIQDCRLGDSVRVPIITWGGDIVTIFAAGDSVVSGPGSIFNDEGIVVELNRVDRFADQVSAYMACESPFIRGTQGQLNLAADLTQSDPRTEMVAILKKSWSNGGDALVVDSTIKDPSDLRGKTIAVMAYGPHYEYLVRILEDAGVGLDEVNILWVRDLTGTNETPAQAMRERQANAAFVIIPDALALTSDGTIGTGAGDSVEGVTILLSTKTASRVISDVYAVRKDFFEANREFVHAFVRSWLMAEEMARDSVADSSMNWSVYAEILLDDAGAVADAQGLWADAETSGFRENFNWADINSRRGWTAVNNEIQSAFVRLGLMERTWNIAVADWDYSTFEEYVSDTGGVELSRFDANAVNRVVTAQAATGVLDDNTLFEFEINFKPNDKNFNSDLQMERFREVIRRASIYSGAVITIEGHSDPLNYLQREQAGAQPIELRRIRQSALNLSAERAASVREVILEMAEAQGEPMDPSQFAIIPMGISDPLYNPPRTESEWLANMRVVFRIVQLEAEASVFTPLK